MSEDQQYQVVSSPRKSQARPPHTTAGNTASAHESIKAHNPPPGFQKSKTDLRQRLWSQVRMPDSTYVLYTQLSGILSLQAA